MPSFEIEQDPAVIKQVKGKPRHGSFIGALRAGEVVFIPGSRTYVGGPRTLLAKDGLTLRTKAGEKASVVGCYVWAEPKP